MKTTDVGYIIENGQEVVRPTGLRGTDHAQYVHVLRCNHCFYRYGANGSDVHDRKCPVCQGGKSGLPYAQGYLLTWNPRRWPWTDLAEAISAIRTTGTYSARWSCGNATSIPVGARVFLLRQGAADSGIVGAGWVTRAPFKDVHWDEARRAAGHTANYVLVDFDALLDPAARAPLDLRRDPSPNLAGVRWSSPASGVAIPPEGLLEIERLWEASGIPQTTGAAEMEETLSALEGEERRRMVIHRQRERTLRQAKIDAVMRSNGGRLRCEVPGCGFDFEAKYGALGAGYAQVHHLHPLSATHGPVRTTLDDLVVVCANCHAMIHRWGETRTLDSLVTSRG